MTLRRADVLVILGRGSMAFTWDSRKSRTNRRKHGVSFIEAVSAFDDPYAVYLEEEADPDRAILIGMSEEARVLFIVHVDVSEDDVRIISARKANARERRIYAEGA